MSRQAGIHRCCRCYLLMRVIVVVGAMADGVVSEEGGEGTGGVGGGRRLLKDLLQHDDVRRRLPGSQPREHNPGWGLVLLLVSLC